MWHKHTSYRIIHGEMFHNYLRYKKYYTITVLWLRSYATVSRQQTVGLQTYAYSNSSINLTILLVRCSYQAWSVKVQYRVSDITPSSRCVAPLPNTQLRTDLTITGCTPDMKTHRSLLRHWTHRCVDLPCTNCALALRSERIAPSPGPGLGFPLRFAVLGSFHFGAFWSTIVSLQWVSPCANHIISRKEFLTLRGIPLITEILYTNITLQKSIPVPNGHCP